MLRRNKNLIMGIWVVFILIGIILIFLYRASSMNKLQQLNDNFHGTLLSVPREISAFSLQGIDRQPLTLESLRGRWTMIFFGFTNCGYVCPTSMMKLGQMYALLKTAKVNPLPLVVMVSIDPVRDNLLKLRQYVKSFNKEFYGARGTEDVIKLLTANLGIAYAKVMSAKNSQSGDYDIQHSGAVILINPDSKLHAFFTPPLLPRELAEDYQMLVTK